MELLNQHIHGLGSLNTSLQGKQPALLKFDKKKQSFSKTTMKCELRLPEEYRDHIDYFNLSPGSYFCTSLISGTLL